MAEQSASPRVITDQTPSLFPEYIFGIHGSGGASLMEEAGRPGWVLETVELGLDVRKANVIDCELNNGFMPLAKPFPGIVDVSVYHTQYTYFSGQ